MTDKTIILRSRGTEPFATIEAEKLKIGDAEVNVHRLRKEIIPLGETRKHPDKGYTIEVPRERAEKWIKNFALMQSRGHAVPAPPDHKGGKENYGRWTGFSLGTNARGGQSLFGEIRIVGDKALEQVLNKDVSIFTTADLPDDKGNVYDEAIEHVSVCTFPALTELSGWAPIAASRGDATVPVFELSATPTKEPVMDLEALRTALGAADTVSDADVLTQATAKITGIPGAIDAAKTAAVTPIAAERDELKTARDQLKTDLDLARKPGGTPLNPEVAHERRLRIASKIGELRGTKDWTTKAINLLCGQKEAPNTLMLSRANDAAEDVRAVEFIELMRDFKPANKSGEDSGAQILDLDRKTPPGSDVKEDAAKAGQEGRDAAAEFQKKQLAARGLSAA